MPPGRDDFSADQARNAWRIFCSHWHLFRGTPMKFWMESELVDIFGVDVRPSAETADRIYDAIAAKLARDRAKIEAIKRIREAPDAPAASEAPQDAPDTPQDAPDAD